MSAPYEVGPLVENLAKALCKLEGHRNVEQQVTWEVLYKADKFTYAPDNGFFPIWRAYIAHAEKAIALIAESEGTPKY